MDRALLCNVIHRVMVEKMAQNSRLLIMLSAWQCTQYNLHLLGRTKYEADTLRILALKVCSITQKRSIRIFIYFKVTGKSLSEALIFASTNPQYDDTLFIELQLQYMKIPSSEHGENMLCTEIVSDIQDNLCTQHVFHMFCKNKSF